MSQCPYANLLDPHFLGEGMDHEAVAAIRAAGPAIKIEDPATGVPYWAVTQHAAIDYVSKNNALFSSQLRSAIPMEMDQEMVDNIQTRMFINLDPPLNLDYRKLIRDHFTPAAVAKLEPKAREYAKEIVDRVIDEGSCEFVTQVAAELPLLMILDFFDIPAEDRAKFFEWTNLMMFADDPESGGEEAAQQAAADLMVYAFELAQKWRGSPERNVSAQLLEGVINGEPVSDETFAWIVLMILSAGNESTRTTISHAMRNLMENPEQYRLLQENPDKIEAATMEVVRYNPPFVCMRRTATEDVTAPELGNAPIKKGDKVIMYYPGANFDESVFGEDALQFDVERGDRQDMRRDIRSFGIGLHNCFGMNLAKMEMRVMMEEVLSRMDNPQFAGEVDYMKSNFIQGIRSMPITFEKRGA